MKKILAILFSLVIVQSSMGTCIVVKYCEKSQQYSYSLIHKKEECRKKCCEKSCCKHTQLKVDKTDDYMPSSISKIPVPAQTANFFNKKSYTFGSNLSSSLNLNTINHEVSIVRQQVSLVIFNQTFLI